MPSFQSGLNRFKELLPLRPRENTTLAATVKPAPGNPADQGAREGGPPAIYGKNNGRAMAKGLIAQQLQSTQLTSDLLETTLHAAQMLETTQATLQSIREISAVTNDLEALAEPITEHLHTLNGNPTPQQRNHALAALIDGPLRYANHKLTELRQADPLPFSAPGPLGQIDPPPGFPHSVDLRTKTLAVMREAVLSSLIKALDSKSSTADSALVLGALGMEKDLNAEYGSRLLRQMPSMRKQDRRAVAELMIARPLTGPASSLPEAAKSTGNALLSLFKDPAVEKEIKVGMLRALGPGCQFDRMTEVTKACARSGMHPMFMKPLLDAIKNHPLPLSEQSLKENFLVMVGESKKLLRADQSETVEALRDAWAAQGKNTGTPFPQEFQDTFDTLIAMRRSRSSNNDSLN